MFLILFLRILCFGCFSLPLALPLPLSLPFSLLESSIPPSASIYLHVTCTFTFYSLLFYISSPSRCLSTFLDYIHVAPLIYVCKHLNLGNTLVRAWGSCFSESGLPHLIHFTSTHFLTNFIFLYGWTLAKYVCTTFSLFSLLMMDF